MIIRMEQRSAL